MMRGQVLQLPEAAQKLFLATLVRRWYSNGRRELMSRKKVPPQVLFILRTTDVAKMLKASRFALNRIISRCQLGSSVSGGGVRGRELLFAVEDAARLALAYWLSRAGLHTGAIREFLAVPELDEFSRTLRDPWLVEIEARDIEYLVCWSEPLGRSKAKPEKPPRGYEVIRKVALCPHIEAVEHALAKVRQPAFVVLPIGRLLTELAEKMKQSMQVK